MDHQDPPEDDYYAILGVRPDAKIEVIRSSYRKLALENHPDRNLTNDERKNQKMKSVNHAYNILSNPDKRREYDDKRNFDEKIHRPDINMNPFDLLLDETVFNQLFGNCGRDQKKISQNGSQRGRAHQVNRRSRSTISGTSSSTRGSHSSKHSSRHNSTKYSSRSNKSNKNGHHRHVRIYRDLFITLEDVMLGGLKAQRVFLSKRESAVAYVKIPKGVTDGYQITLSDVNFGSKLGYQTVIFKIRISDHPRFNREGCNIRCTAHITRNQVIKGFRLKIPTLDDNKKIIEKRIHPKQAMRTHAIKFRGFGLPRFDKPSQRGDLIVDLVVRHH